MLTLPECAVYTPLDVALHVFGIGYGGILIFFDYLDDENNMYYIDFLHSKTWSKSPYRFPEGFKECESMILITDDKIVHVIGTDNEYNTKAGDRRHCYFNLTTALSSHCLVRINSEQVDLLITGFIKIIDEDNKSQLMSNLDEINASDTNLVNLSRFLMKLQSMPNDSKNSEIC